MANVYEAFSFSDATVTGKVFADLTVDYCKKTDGTNVSQSGMTLTELGVGDYVLMNPNVTERTICRIHLTSDSTKRAVVVFDPIDGNIAPSSTALSNATWTDAKAGYLDAAISDVKSKTDNLPSDPADESLIIAATDAISASITALNNLSAAEINAELVDVLRTDAGTELSAVPATTATLQEKIDFLFQYFRNKRTVTATTETLFKEDATTELGSATVSDDGSTFTKGEMA